MDEAATEHCGVCGQTMESEHSAHCAFCGTTFHLTWDTRKPIQDCGRFDLDEESMGLFFTCNPCLEKMGGPQRTMQRKE